MPTEKQIQNRKKYAVLGRIGGCQHNLEKLLKQYETLPSDTKSKLKLAISNLKLALLSAKKWRLDDVKWSHLGRKRLWEICK